MARNPIFSLALAYAIYQALPFKRTDPLLRKIRWFAALGSSSNGLWELLHLTQQYVLAQLVFFEMLKYGVSVHRLRRTMELFIVVAARFADGDTPA